MELQEGEDATIELPESRYDTIVECGLQGGKLRDATKEMKRICKKLKRKQKQLKQIKLEVVNAQGEYRRIRHMVAVLEREMEPLLDVRLPLISYLSAEGS